jgi:HSP20 family molecular chaperone IbpA
LSFDDDFRDMFEDLDLFKLARKSHSELERILERIENGEMKGTWEVKKIDEPDMKGYTIRGRFGLDESLPPLEPIEPLKPSKRRPSPDKLFELPKAALEEIREPLVDMFEEDKILKIYVELPGVEKDDIKLKFNEGCIEINAKNFYKKIELPNRQLATRAVSTEYKNGLLHITIPKTNRLRKEDQKNLKSV